MGVISGGPVRAWRRVAEQLIQLRYPSHHVARRELGRHERAARGCKSRSQLGVREESAQRGRHGAGLGRRDKESRLAVPHHLVHAPDRRGDGGALSRHRLEQRDGEPLVKRRQHEYVARRKQIGARQSAHQET